MSGIEGWFHDNPNVKIITNLDDIGQPYSCNQWGNQHLNFDAIPLMTDDGNQDIIWGWFHTGFAFPSTVYIDHNMTVYFKANNPSPSTAIATIDAMLSECGQACVLAPPSALYDYAIDGNTVSFFDLSEIINEGWIVSEWLWNFGDGNTSNLQNPIHTYENDGIYNVSLQITTDTGLESDLYVDNLTIGALSVFEDLVPDEISISQNYPNPFNPSTSIDFYLPDASFTNINVYDIYGKNVESLVDGFMNSGNHQIIWSPSGLSAGIYFINIKQNNLSKQIKMMYVK